LLLVLLSGCGTSGCGRNCCWLDLLLMPPFVGQLRPCSLLLQLRLLLHLPRFELSKLLLYADCSGRCCKDC
jgi:hypothetical protein